MTLPKAARNLLERCPSCRSFSLPSAIQKEFYASWLLTRQQGPRHVMVPGLFVTSEVWDHENRKQKAAQKPQHADEALRALLILAIILAVYGPWQ